MTFPCISCSSLGSTTEVCFPELKIKALPPGPLPLTLPQPLLPYLPAERAAGPGLAACSLPEQGALWAGAGCIPLRNLLSTFHCAASFGCS